MSKDRMKGFAGEDYEEGDDWAESERGTNKDNEDWSNRDIEYFKKEEQKLLQNGFSVTYTASMIARLKEERRQLISHRRTSKLYEAESAYDGCLGG
tara:strand:+ start:197 stop:484 length:288 start_codon:yes stop_codon:yes gene_type:complete